MMEAAEPPPGQNSVLLRPTENLLDLYFIRRVLEIGKFGKTYLCIERATGQEYACKSFVKSKLVSQEDVDDVRREIEITQLLSGHPNVAAVKGVYEDSTGVHLVLEHCSGGELIDRLILVGRLSEAKVAQLTRVIVGVVEACHLLNIMHRDVRPEKFLLSNNSEDAALKALGFETSVFFQPGEVFTESPGSPYYVAPEVIRRHYGPEADIWSAGVTLYLLLSGVPPFWPETPQGFLDQVLRGEFDLVSEPWPVVSESAKDLVRRMLHVDPQQRLRAHDVLRHPWIQGLGIAPDTRPTGPAAES